MTKLRTAFIALAITSGAAWALKMVAIAALGGAEADGPVIATLWATGMISFVLAAATGVALLLSRAPWWARLLAGVVTVPLAFVAINVLDGVVKSVYTADGWFRDEASLVLGGALMALVGVRVLTAQRSYR